MTTPHTTSRRRLERLAATDAFRAELDRLAQLAPPAYRRELERLAAGTDSTARKAA